jgi:hypothetical protein
MRALIDFDEILYKISFASQHVWYDTKPIEQQSFKYKKEAIAWLTENAIDRRIVVQDIEDVYLTLNSYIHEILERIGTFEYEGFLSGDNNFRKQRATIKPYKGNREVIDKPVHYEAIKGYLKEFYYAQVTDGYEADDALGINQTDDTIIVSQDKDLLMIPGLHYNPTKHERFYITQEQADSFFFCQLLAGDATDNIPGIYNVGLKKAEKFLNKCTANQQRYAIVLEKYTKYLDGEYDVEKYVDEIGDLLWIKRGSTESNWKDLLTRE